MPDPEIGTLFGISFRQLEQLITKVCGANLSILRRPKQIKSWLPKNFREETTTVWSFKQRGDWATHDGRYRGNWSPYIPRNVILKYSHPGDVILDYFVGGGTTAVEAKLLGRRCIAKDINPSAIELTRENLAFSPKEDLLEGPFYEPQVSIGDARDLSEIADNSVDLICSHPPYAGIISYGSAVEGDLSQLPISEFLSEMGKVAKESFRVLKPGGQCAILIGDTRKSKHIVPIGFQTIRVFLNAGFVLRELVIKRQHNCKTTGFWYTRSIQYNFLLLAHEYLPIFEKPVYPRVYEPEPFWEYPLPYQGVREQILRVERENLETTTVWILPKNNLKEEIKRNLLARLAPAEGEFVEIQFEDCKPKSSLSKEKTSLLYIHFPASLKDEREILSYRNAVKNIAEQIEHLLIKGGYFIIDTQDLRINNVLWPMGLLLYEDLSSQKNLSIKEIVVVVPEQFSPRRLIESGYLDIVHKYLLIFVYKTVGKKN